MAVWWSKIKNPSLACQIWRSKAKVLAFDKNLEFLRAPWHGPTDIMRCIFDIFVLKCPKKYVIVCIRHSTNQRQTLKLLMNAILCNCCRKNRGKHSSWETNNCLFRSRILFVTLLGVKHVYDNHSHVFSNCDLVIIRKLFFVHNYLQTELGV